MTPRLIATGIPELLPMVRSGEPHNHISAVIRSLCVKLGHFEAPDDSTLTPNELRDRQTRWELGSAFENAVIHGLVRRYAESDPSRYSIPGELELDGLLGSPDLLDVRDEAVTEVKLTWLSSRHEPDGDKFWKYWVQGACYAHMIGWSTVRVHVAHVNGDYRDRRDPTYNIWEQVYTKRELEMNWKMITSEHRRMRTEVKAKVKSGPRTASVKR